MIPRTITIYGAKYKVKIVKELDADGQIKCSEKLILIRKQKPEDMYHTFLHECLHGVFEEGRVNEVLEDNIEEIVIEQAVKFLLDHFTVKPK